MAALIHDSEDKITDYANWYFVYVLELVIRVNFLKVSGVVLNQEAVDYALESINDWIIYENNLDKDCITHRYKMAQELKRMGITMK